MLSVIWWRLALTKIKQTIAVQRHCTVQLATAISTEVGADKDRADNERTTPLFIAACKGHLDVVRHLVEVGADKDRADNERTTPLFIAARKGHLDVVGHLVEVGADKD